MSIIKPGETHVIRRTTRNQFTGALADLDSNPSAVLLRNGSVDGAVSVTVTKPATGKYNFSFTCPGGYAAGDDLALDISGVRSGISVGMIVDIGVVETRRPSDLPTAAEIWNSATRTLTASLYSVSDIVTAVWGNAARTLTAFAFTVATSPNATETAIKAKTDNLPPSPAAVSDIPTTAQIADAVSLATGPVPVSLTFEDSEGAGVAGVRFTIVGIGSGTANGSGVAAFGLAAGTYTVRSYPASGVILTDATIAVPGSGSLTQTITGTAQSTPDVPADADFCTVYVDFANADGTEVMRLEIVGLPQFIDGRVVINAVQEKSPDPETKRLAFDPVPRGCTIRLSCEKAGIQPVKRYLVPDASTYAITV